MQYAGVKLRGTIWVEHEARMVIILLQMLREGATWEIECVACISRTQGRGGSYCHGRESQASINDMVFSSRTGGPSVYKEGLCSVCW